MGKTETDTGATPNVNPSSGVELIRQIADETLLMARFAARRGLKVPEGTLEEALAVDVLLEAIAAKKEVGSPSIGDNDAIAKRLRSMTRAHQRLSDIVAPATPGSIRDTEGVAGFISAIPNVGVVRNMLILGGLSLAGYVVMLCVSEWVTKGGQIQVAIFQLQLLAAASVGAAFHSLFKANEYVTKGTFDTKYAMSYYIRFFLGIIAGPIIANTFFTLGSGVGAADSAISLQKLGPTAVSLLGGYSADAVNRILTRLVDMMTMLVKGDIKETVEIREAEIRARYRNLQFEQKKELAAQLYELRAAIADPEAAKKIDALVSELIQREEG